MTMKWFGKSWGAPMNDDCPNAPPPVGETCCHCQEGIVAKDSGVIYVNGEVSHRNCFFRMTFGSIAHVEKRCSCYVEGSTCGDAEGLTTREAADQLAKSLGYDEDEDICDFCAARDVPLVLDVTGKKRFIGHFATGSPLIDTGEWGACAECAKLITAKDWNGLLERCIAGTCAMFPDRVFDLGHRQRMKDLVEGVFGVKL